MKDIVIIGAGGFGREVAWLIEDINRIEPTWNVLGYVDDTKELQGSQINGHPVLGPLSSISQIGNTYVAIGVGSPKSKQQIVERISIYGHVMFANLIHPTVVFSEWATLGKGNIICAGSMISVNVSIRDYVTINLQCTLGHDVQVDSYATIAPGVNLSGYVEIGSACDVGTGSSVVQNITVGSGTIIGAGAVVAKHLPSDCTAVGVPAKPIKYHNVDSEEHL